MKIARIRWKNDKPASAKQIAHVHDLLAALKAKLPATSQTAGSPEAYAHDFWIRSVMPARLTMIEASTLIKYFSAAKHDWASATQELLYALPKRVRLDHISADLPGVMLTSVFAAACEPLVQYLETRDRWPAMLKLREKRLEARQASAPG